MWGGGTIEESFHSRTWKQLTEGSTLGHAWPHYLKRGRCGLWLPDAACGGGGGMRGWCLPAQDAREQGRPNWAN